MALDDRVTLCSSRLLSSIFFLLFGVTRVEGVPFDVVCECLISRKQSLLAVGRVLVGVRLLLVLGGRREGHRHQLVFQALLRAHILVRLLPTVECEPFPELRADFQLRILQLPLLNSFDLV